jgi:hypothetical protein
MQFNRSPATFGGRLVERHTGSLGPASTLGVAGLFAGNKALQTLMKLGV